MPQDQWRQANNRAKYGPVVSTNTTVLVRKKRRRHMGRRPNPSWGITNLFIIYAGTPAKVIRPNGESLSMRTRKELRFGSVSQDHQEEGHFTFKRFGYWLIVPAKLIGRRLSGT